MPLDFVLMVRFVASCAGVGVARIECLLLIVAGLNCVVWVCLVLFGFVALRFFVVGLPSGVVLLCGLLWLPVF